MKDRLFTPYPIQWHEGMFMLPQHFQQQDLLQQNLWSYHVGILAPYHWGVKSFDIDQQALLKGVFRLTRFEGVMPDGTLIFFPLDNDESLEINLGKPEPNKPFLVHITLPKDMSKDDSRRDRAARFSTVEHVISDLNDTNSRETISRLRPRLSLHVGDQIPAQKFGMPIAQFMMRSDRFYREQYTPPPLTFETDHPLRKEAEKLVEEVREKLLYLHRKLKARARSSTSLFDAQSIWQMDMMRRHLIQGLIPLEALLAEPVVLPHPLFNRLIELTSQCAALRWGESPPLFPSYQHTHVGPCFDRLFSFVRETLRQIQEAYRAYPLDPSDRSFKIKIKKGWLAQPLTLGIQSPRDEDEDKMRTWISDAIIASSSFLETIQNNRILGAKREIIQTSNRLQLVPDRGTILCEIPAGDKFIKEDEEIHIFNISDDATSRPQSVTLYLGDQEKEPQPQKT